jgi:hypothetical protein
MTTGWDQIKLQEGLHVPKGKIITEALVNSIRDCNTSPEERKKASSMLLSDREE